jgi:hypothetical protein
MADYTIIVRTDDGRGWRALDLVSGDRVLIENVQVANLEATTQLVAPSGVAFPGTPTTAELFWKSDEQTLYRYNGTIWEQVQGSADGVSEALGAIEGNPHGFLNQTDTTMSFDNGTRTFTLAPAAAEFDYYYKGAKVTKTAAENIIISNDNGVHFVYYDATETLQDSLSPWSLSEHVPVATIHWNGDITLGCVGEERHSVLMPWRTHLYLHRANGTRYITGLTASGYVLNSDTDADVTIGISDGTIYDEDISINIKNDPTPTERFEQILADPAELPVMFRQTLLGDWRTETATPFYFSNEPAGLIHWNEWTGSQWQKTEAQNGYHVAVWIFATNHLERPVVSIMGQREDNNLPDAIDNNLLANMDWGTFPFQESKVIYRIILQTGTSYGGTRKVKVQDVTDFRSLSALATGGFVPIEHSSLGGLATSGHPATVIAPDTANFDKVLSGADTTSQLAFETLDEHRHALKSGAVAAGSFAGNPAKATVTFSSAYPDTNYAVAAISVATLNSSYCISIESKTTTGFVLNTNTNNISDLVEVTWKTLPYGE